MCACVCVCVLCVCMCVCVSRLRLHIYRRFCRALCVCVCVVYWYSLRVWHPIVSLLSLPCVCVYVCVLCVCVYVCTCVCVCVVCGGRTFQNAGARLRRQFAEIENWQSAHKSRHITACMAALHGVIGHGSGSDAYSRTTLAPWMVSELFIKASMLPGESGAKAGQKGVAH